MEQTQSYKVRYAALMSVSLTLPIIVTYFFAGMVLLFAAIITANIYDL